MRAPIATIFHETVNHCFNSALEGIGGPVKEHVYDFLAEKGIGKDDISNHFDDVVRILTETFGPRARVIIYKTMVELHKEYSLVTDFSYQDSLRDRMSVLKSRVVADHLIPKRVHRKPTILETPPPGPVVQSPLSAAAKK